MAASHRVLFVNRIQGLGLDLGSWLWRFFELGVSIVATYGLHTRTRICRYSIAEPGHAFSGEEILARVSRAETSVLLFWGWRCLGFLRQVF